jgi:succinate-semialdehyde dehydrogenase/glutarate-semialdehyde dehydrogenase
MDDTYRVINPADGVLVEAFPTTSDADLALAIERVHTAFLRHRGLAVVDRVVPLRRAAALLRDRAAELAEIAAVEMGKPRAQGCAEAEFSADIFDYYADNSERFLRPQPIPSQTGDAWVERLPLGALLGVMPWNYPFYQAARFVAPNLALGNTVLLKPAESCPRSALAFQGLLRDAGVADGALRVVFASHAQIQQVIADGRIRGVSLTGSERAGAAIASAAGRQLKKVVLELGGSDAYVVLDTASEKSAAETAWNMRMENMGQACNSNKRMIVLEPHYTTFVDELVRLARSLRPGDPLSLAAGEYAPMSSRRAAEHLRAQVEDAVSRGAVLHAGGTLHDDRSAYFAPAVLTGVTPQMRAYHEELFGPVAVVHRAADEAEALRIANDTDFGLGAAVFSTDPDRARQFGAKLDTGMLAINAAAAEGAELPFGGVKRSGYGRELGPLGIDEFVNKRLVYRATAAGRS